MKDKILTDHEFNQVIQSLKGTTHEKRNICLMYFSCNLGLRAIEMANIRLGDVVNIGHVNMPIKNYFELSVTKNNKKRMVYLEDINLKKALIDYLHVVSIPQPHVFTHLFRSQKGGAFTPNTLQQLFHRIYKEAGIEGATSHTGRRSFITKLLHEKKVPIKYVQEAAGHATPAMTLHYAKIDREKLKDIYGSGLY